MSIYPSLPRAYIRLAILATAALVAVLIVSCTPTHEGGLKDTPGSAGGQRLESDLTNNDSTYIGEKACLECHEHAAQHASMGVHAAAFRSNPRNSRQGEVCEACHGPGSKHAEGAWDRSLIIGFTRNWGTPVAKQNAQCLSCHQGAQRVNWVRSTHDVNGVACADCHNPMEKNSVTGALVRNSISETCYTCHPQQRAEFLRRSHMPLPEGKMSCEDCHNPHGSPTRPLLKTDTINELCYQCHAEKRGPFIWEHAPVRENCANCHLPHGSNNDKLLITPRPFLCQQCHDPSVGHPGNFYNNSQTAESAGAAQASGILAVNLQSQRIIGRACQNCHTQIHGSNHPSGARWQR
jgi:DmsE family decaheme c-type cytochrome